MTDVYNNDEFTRNSIQSVPASYAEDASTSMIKFLGSFWRNIHEGREFLSGIHKVRGLTLAQFYLDLLETLKLQDRKGMPVFHREMWKPLVIRLSERDKAQENILKVGGEMTLGPQGPGSKYGEGTELSVGVLAGLDGYVTYPVDGEIHSIVSGICNNVISPTVSYKVSSEFPSDDVTYINGTLIFPKDKDPFAKGSGFEVYDVVDDVAEGGSSTEETVLWASDAIVDKNYISEHMAYALGVSCESSDIIKRILNAGWDAINCGLTPELVRTILASMANIPVIQHPDETVSYISEEGDGTKKVTTDKGTYTVYKGAKLRECVSVGSVLHRGDLLDQSIKIYPIITDPSGEKLENTSEYGDIIRTDVPVISIPRTLVRTRTSNGLAVDWLPTDVLWSNGDYDKNGHRKLYFHINGPEADVKAFWNDVWESTEEENIDLDDLFQDCEYSEDESESSSSEPWQIVPAAFFLKHMIGANTLIVTIDRSQVEDTSMIMDQKYFDILNNVVPPSMRLFFVEHVQVGDEHDSYNTDRISGHGEYATGTEDYVDAYVAEDIGDDEFSYNSLPGIKGKHIPTYEDQVEMKFMRNRKRSADKN